MQDRFKKLLPIFHLLKRLDGDPAVRLMVNCNHGQNRSYGFFILYLMVREWNLTQASLDQKKAQLKPAYNTVTKQWTIQLADLIGDNPETFRCFVRPSYQKRIGQVSFLRPPGRMLRSGNAQ
jgi:hypothetical protein